MTKTYTTSNNSSSRTVALDNNHLSIDGELTELCHDWSSNSVRDNDVQLGSEAKIDTLEVCSCVGV